jgi:spermidine synthase
MRRARPFETPFRYIDDFALGLAYHPSARNVLFVGLGGGSAPKRFWRDFPQLQLQAVELDPVVRDVAYRWFRLPRHPRLRVTAEDGRSYLQQEKRRWDVIALDAYYSDSIPFHLATREFLELVRERLAPGGVVLANVVGSLTGPDSQLFRAFYRTYRSVFPSVAVHPVDYTDSNFSDIQNLIVVAGEGALPSRSLLQKRWREVRRRYPTAVDLREAIGGRYDGFIPTENVPVLTDDYAPTDALIIVG